MFVKTILNRVEKFKSFVYGECIFEKIGKNASIIVEDAARKNARGLCPECHKPSPSCDKQPLRCPSGIYPCILHIPQDVSIAQYTASELSFSLGVMEKNR
jgi:hypothetical protein